MINHQIYHELPRRFAIHFGFKFPGKMLNSIFFLSVLSSSGILVKEQVGVYQKGIRKGRCSSNGKDQDSYHFVFRSMILKINFHGSSKHFKQSSFMDLQSKFVSCWLSRTLQVHSEIRVETCSPLKNHLTYSSVEALTVAFFFFEWVDAEDRMEKNTHDMSVYIYI